MEQDLENLLRVLLLADAGPPNRSGHRAEQEPVRRIPSVPGEALPPPAVYRRQPRRVVSDLFGGREAPRGALAGLRAWSSAPDLSGLSPPLLPAIVPPDLNFVTTLGRRTASLSDQPSCRSALSPRSPSGTQSPFARPPEGCRPPLGPRPAPAESQQDPGGS